MRIPTRPAVLLLAGLAACQNASSTRSGEGSQEMKERPPIAFPRQSPGREAMYEALIEGRLVLDDGCLRVDTPQGESYLVLWPPRAELREEAGRVIDHETGAMVEIGKSVRMSGGEVSLKPFVLEQLENPPPARCPAPYWLAGHVLPSAP